MCVCGRSVAKNAGSNPVGVWSSVSCKCCVLPGRYLWVGEITCPEESYRMCCVSDQEALTMRMYWPNSGCWAKEEK
jgi:hypothetical protein